VAFVLAEICCPAEDAHRLRALVKVQFATHRMAAGWRGCRIGFDLLAPGRLVLFEQWATAAALQLHLRSGRNIAFVDAVRPLLAGLPTTRIIETADDDDATGDIVDAADTPATEFLIYQTRRHGTDDADAREALAAVDALFRTCPGYLASHLAEDILEWREPRDAMAAAVEPELLRLAVAAAPLFREPLRFRRLGAIFVDAVETSPRSLAEHLADDLDLR
jgi:quinol monooxygenase YgiN